MKTQPITPLTLSKSATFAPHQADTMIRLRDISLRYRYRRSALRHIDLNIEEGSYQYLIGPSGAGKTSLFGVIGLYHRPCEGSVSVFGINVADASDFQRCLIRQNIGIVFQDFRLLPHISAFDNVGLPLRLMGVQPAAISKSVSELMGWLGLENLIEKLPEQLSIGERQLTAIARGVITRPRLLLADEPTSSVDEKRSLRVMSLFDDLNRTGTTVIVATHSKRLMRSFPHTAIEIEGGMLNGFQHVGAAPGPRDASLAMAS